MGDLPIHEQASLLTKAAGKKAIEDEFLALEYLQKAAQIVQSEKNEYLRSSVQQQIAAQYINLKKWDEARRIASEIAVIFDRIPLLCSLAQALISTSQRDAALEVVAGTVPLIDKIDAQEPEQSWLIHDIAETYSQLGDFTRARDLWILALAGARGSQDADKLLLLICKAFANLNDKALAHEAALKVHNLERRRKALAICE